MALRINKQLTSILNKQMDRKDFLKYSGGVLLAVVGITGLLNALSGTGNDDSARGGGYGNTPYGS
jgi:hypothetical protein